MVLRDAKNDPPEDHPVPQPRHRPGSVCRARPDPQQRTWLSRAGWEPDRSMWGRASAWIHHGSIRGW